MSIRGQIALLEELAAIDSELRRLGEQLGRQQGNLDGMRSELKELDARLSSDRDALAAMEKMRGEYTQELRQMAQQIERSREKLQRSRNERESNAAQRELEELRKLHKDREEEIARLTTTSEALKSSIDKTDAKRREVDGSLSGSAEGISASLMGMEGEKAKHEEKRKAVVGKIPKPLYARYESIRTRRPVAIAKLLNNGTCTGCNIAIPPMMFQKMLRQEEFEQCPSCRRILYYSPPNPVGREAEGGNSSTAESSRA